MIRRMRGSAQLLANRVATRRDVHFARVGSRRHTGDWRPSPRPGEHQEHHAGDRRGKGPCSAPMDITTKRLRLRAWSSHGTGAFVLGGPWATPTGAGAVTLFLLVACDGCSAGQILPLPREVHAMRPWLRSCEPSPMQLESNCVRAACPFRLAECGRSTAGRRQVRSRLYG